MYYITRNIIKGISCTQKQQQQRTTTTIIKTTKKILLFHSFWRNENHFAQKQKKTSHSLTD